MTDSVISIMDAVALGGVFSALAVLLASPPRILPLNFKRILVCLLVFMGSYELLMLMEWAGLTGQFETVENHVGALLPLWWLFAFYALSQAVLYRDLALSEQRLANAVDATKDGIWDWKVVQGTVFFSPHWFNMLGYEPGELPATFETWANLLHPDDKDEAKALVRRYMDLDAPFEVEVRMLTKAGSWRWVLTRGKVVARDEEGNALRMAGTLVDINRRKEQEEELRAAKEAAEAAARAKSNFLANMSHEIRTPLNGILGILQMLRKTETNPKRLEFADQGIKAGNRLTRLLSDILQLAGEENQATAMASEPFDFQDTMEAVSQLYSPAALQKGLEFSMRLDPAIPPTLIGDATRLQQILGSLLENAIKFTESGNVALAASLAAPPENNRCQVDFKIVDTGVGIPENKLAIVLGNFDQVQEGYTRQHQGAGLGLALARQLAERMQGSITLQSAPAQGTTALLRLPFVASALEE